MKICTSMQEEWRQIPCKHDQLTPIRLLVQVTEFFSRKNFSLPENKQTIPPLLSEMHLHWKIVSILYKG